MFFFFVKRSFLVEFQLIISLNKKLNQLKKEIEKKSPDDIKFHGGKRNRGFSCLCT